jgi:hypothetical protein
MRTGDPTRTAREVVELYNLSVWNDRDFDLALELVADAVIRLEVGSGHALTRELIRKGIEGPSGDVRRVALGPQSCHRG